MKVVAVIPALQAGSTVGAVITTLREHWPPSSSFSAIVVDDGSTDDTAARARDAGAEVVAHASNLGKGNALRTGLEAARARGSDAAVTVDADGQHPAEEAVRVAFHSAPAESLVLGVRDLLDAGAPRANRFSNGFSNAWLSWFSGHRLLDTQCGLRRYPVRQTLDLGVRAAGYGFEAEVLLRAARAGWRIEQLPVRVIYPPKHQHTTHFHSVRDPARIVLRILYTVATTSGPR